MLPRALRAASLPRTSRATLMQRPCLAHATPMVQCSRKGPAPPTLVFRAPLARLRRGNQDEGSLPDCRAIATAAHGERGRAVYDPQARAYYDVETGALLADEAAWERASEDQRDKARRKLAAVRRAEELIALCIPRCEADATAAKEAGIASGVLGRWRRKLRGLPKDASVAALLDARRPGRPSLIDAEMRETLGALCGGFPLPRRASVRNAVSFLSALRAHVHDSAINRVSPPILERFTEQREAASAAARVRIVDADGVPTTRGSVPPPAPGDRPLATIEGGPDGSVLDPAATPLVLMPDSKMRRDGGPCRRWNVTEDSLDETEDAFDAANFRMGWSPEEADGMFLASMGGGTARPGWRLRISPVSGCRGCRGRIGVRESPCGQNNKQLIEQTTNVRRGSAMARKGPMW